MCHDVDSRPPAPPIVGPVAEHGPLTLRAGDGAALYAYQALPSEPNGAKIVLLPDVRGLHPYYVDLAQRFAEAGYATTAIDYFGRTTQERDRGESFDWKAHLSDATHETIKLDTAAAIAHLNEVASGPVFTVGFCFGGSNSWKLSASDLDLAGVIGFYGRPELVVDVVDQLHKPMLLLLAGNDLATTPTQSAEFAAQLDAVGVEYVQRVYEGAPHSFFDRSFADFADACSDAWQQILDFTAEHGTVSVG